MTSTANVALPPQPEFRSAIRPEQIRKSAQRWPQCKLLSRRQRRRAGNLVNHSRLFLWNRRPAIRGQWAVRRWKPVPNLGSSYIASLSLPVWNWGATESRVRAARAATHASQARTLLCPAQAPRRNALPLFRSRKPPQRTRRPPAFPPNSPKKASAHHDALSGREATVLEVVDAQTTFAQANAAYQDGAVRYRVALANLQTLTGVLTTP